MARIGMNPSRSKTSDYRPARVTVAILVHVPHLSGYYEGRDRVVEACLESLRLNTSVDYDLLVFDNASCDEIRDYLLRLESEGFIRYLLRSHINLGKIGALKVMFPAAPGEIIAYSDDDFFYEPGWLSEHLKILDSFPRVGMVSGYVVPTLFVHERTSSSVDFGKSEKAELSAGKFTEEVWIREWAESTGREPSTALAEASAIEEYVVKYAGVEAFATANHDQFLAPKEVMLDLLPREWSGRLMGEMLELDERVNAAGFLRLATRQRTTRHLGNLLPPDLASRVGLGDGSVRRTESSAGRKRGAWRRRLLTWPPVRAILLALYSRLFHWINPE